MGFAYIEGRKQWHGREDEKSMMIVSHARYIRVRVVHGRITTTAAAEAAVIAKPSRTSKVLLPYHHFSSPTI